jgi:HlyD family secretion protein
MEMRLTLLIVLILFYACNNNGEHSDAYGNFQAEEYLIASETNGKLISFSVEEGKKLEANEVVGIIDTIQLSLKIKQLEVQKKAVETKLININSQINVLQEQKKVLMKELDRFKKLVDEGAATQKNLDDISGQIDILDKQISATSTQKIPVQSEIENTEIQISQLKDQFSKSFITNPISGIVLEKYINENELVIIGKLLYKIADLENMELKAYVSGDQLPNIKIGQKVIVMIDKNKEENQEFFGTISWISDEAEFTPKIIQTKEERVDQVYAIKVKVKNDGRIKIGMPGEVIFNQNQSEE